MGIVIWGCLELWWGFFIFIFWKYLVICYCLDFMSLFIILVVIIMLMDGLDFIWICIYVWSSIIKLYFFVMIIF